MRRLLGMSIFGDRLGRPRGLRVVLAVLVAAPVLAGVGLGAPGVVGLLNPSFEADANTDRLPDDWTARIAPADGGPPVAATCPNPPDQRRICVVGTDSFTPTGGSLVTVQPIDGGKMVRLGGPFLNDDQTQNRERFLLEQTFVVDPDLKVKDAVDRVAEKVGSSITVTDFVRFALGEGLESGGGPNLAEEVAQLAGR
jgi:hypothetical protein